jgi:hypothetical protein
VHVSLVALENQNLLRGLITIVVIGKQSLQGFSKGRDKDLNLCRVFDFVVLRALYQLAQAVASLFLCVFDDQGFGCFEN